MSEHMYQHNLFPLPILFFFLGFIVLCECVFILVWLGVIVDVFDELCQWIVWGQVIDIVWGLLFISLSWGIW